MPEEIPEDITETPVLNPTETLALRPADLDDAEDYARLVSENIDHVSKWIPVQKPSSTIDERRSAMATELESVSSGYRRWWLIESHGELAGTIDLHRIHNSTGRAMVGFWLAEGFTGQGIMTRSLRAIIDWAFSELGLIRIEIESSVENRAGCAVSERLGIRRESIRRQSNVINGVTHDMASYVAFADNWPPKPPKGAMPRDEIQLDDEIRLRPIVEGDQDAMWQAIDAGRDYLGEYLRWIKEYPSENQHTSGFRTRLFERDNFDRSAGYVIEYRGELAGNVGFGVPNRDNSAEIGYWLREDLQGRGIMTRAVEVVINMLIHEMGIHRVTIRAATTNLPSRGIPERLGFTHEGTLRGAGLVKNEYLDLEIYSILDHEWLARSKYA